MNRLARLLLPLGLALALACGSGGSGGEAAPGGEAPGAENPAPDFSLPDLEGNTVALSALRGQVVVIDFWATWCPPCEFQIPILNEVYAAERDSGVAILGVSVDTEGPDVVRAYIEKHGATYPILLGSEKLARQFGAPGFPALILVGPEGGIEQIHVGLIEAPELREAIASLRGEAAPAAADEPA